MGEIEVVSDQIQEIVRQGEHSYGVQGRWPQGSNVPQIEALVLVFFQHNLVEHFSRSTNT